MPLSLRVAIRGMANCSPYNTLSAHHPFQNKQQLQMNSHSTQEFRLCTQTTQYHLYTDRHVLQQTLGDLQFFSEKQKQRKSKIETCLPTFCADLPTFSGIRDQLHYHQIGKSDFFNMLDFHNNRYLSLTPVNMTLMFTSILQYTFYFLPFFQIYFY